MSRQSGSHKIYTNDAGKRVTVPYHSGKTLHPKVLLSILKDVEITRDELIEILE
jgi:predicted RNA binding protein YcfA (HicA-like mRNA interferase family)